MSLLTFFTQQRQQWLAQAPNHPADAVLGGLAALVQAETAFRALPLYNAHQQAATAQRELAEVSYKLSRARLQIQELEDRLGTAKIKQANAQKQVAELPRWHEQRALRASRLLRRIAVAARQTRLGADERLHWIQEAVQQFLVVLAGEVLPSADAATPEADGPDAPEADGPLP